MPVDCNVASILDRETLITIDNWYSRVEKETELIVIPLSRAERCAHLPKMFVDIVARLGIPVHMRAHALPSDAARDHGVRRRDQGYTAAMIVEESRMLQVSIFETLHVHLAETNPQVLLLDVMTIADEVDSQLAQAMASYGS